MPRVLAEHNFSEDRAKRLLKVGESYVSCAESFPDGFARCGETSHATSDVASAASIPLLPSRRHDHNLRQHEVIVTNQLKAEKVVFYIREHVARLVKASPFPQQVALSGKRIAWLDSEIDEKIAARAAEHPRKRTALSAF